MSEQWEQTIRGWELHTKYYGEYRVTLTGYALYIASGCVKVATGLVSSVYPTGKLGEAYTLAYGKIAEAKEACERHRDTIQTFMKELELKFLD